MADSPLKVVILQQPLAISPSPTGFNYYSPFTINSGQVPSTQTDFPILISVTDTRFKTVANGGHVQDAQGDDIRPYSDSGITTAITGYEKVFYDGVNGILEMWVKRSSVADGLVTYLAYGNPTLTTDASSTATWSNSFGAVYHLKDGTTLSLVDSLGANNLQFSVSHATAAAGQIDGCASLASASSQGFQGWQFNAAAMTLSVWANGTTFPAAYQDPIIQINGSGTLFNLIAVKSTGKMRWAINATTLLQADGTGSTTLSTSTWYHLVLTYDSTAGLVGYVNASVDKTIAANGACSNISSTMDVGYTSLFNTQFWNGKLDEVRFASVARSADWVTTEYNNQNAPATFQTLGTEVTL